MANIVYVHAYTEDRVVKNQLMIFLDRLRSAFERNYIPGLERILPVTSKDTLDILLEKQPENFKKEVEGHYFMGLGIWSEWRDLQSIDKFHASQLHSEFSSYASTTLVDTWYKIVQLREGKLSVRQIGSDWEE